MNKKIAVLAGDGIGPEDRPGGHCGVGGNRETPVAMRLSLFPPRSAARLLTTRTGPSRTKTLHLAKTSDAVLLGAVGGPKWEGLEYERRPERALLGLRERLGLFANLRPAKLYSELADASTLKREVIEGIDVFGGA